MKPFLYISLALIVSGCSSVVKMENQTTRLEKPYFKEYRTSLETVSSNKNDYKFRIHSKDKANYALLPLKYPENTDQILVKMLYKEISVFWERTGHKEKKLSGNQETLLKECEKEQIDAVITPSLFVGEGKWTLTQTVTDPVNGKEYGKFENVIIPNIPGETQEKRSFKQIEIFYDGKNYLPVKELNTPALAWESRPEGAELTGILDDSITGLINIGATSSGTVAELDGKKLDEIPVRGQKIADGKHTIVFRKRGKKPVIREFVVRAGEESSIFHEWDDDTSSAALKVVSFPEGIKVAIDGTVKGKTPVFENGLLKGKSSVEYVKDAADGSLIVLGEHSFEIDPGKLYAVALPYNMTNSGEAKDFWIKSGSADFTVNYGQDFGFQLNKNLPAGWYGVISEPLVPDVIEFSSILPLSSAMDGSLSFSIFEMNSNNKIFTLQITGEKLSVYKFPSDGVAVGSYKFKKEDEKNPRKIRIVTDSKKNQIRIFLGKTAVLTEAIDFKSLWRIGILTRGENFTTKGAIKEMKIVYPELQKQMK